MHIQNLDPIKQKLAYIKGIAKNRFQYFDSQRASIILNNYIKALSTHGYDESTIIKDLEEELMPRTKEVHNWTEWTNLLDGWMKSIEKWSIEEDKEEEREEYDIEKLKMYADFSIMEIDSKEKVFNYIAKSDPNFNEGEFRLTLYTELLNTLKLFSNCEESEYKKYKNQEIKADFISQIVSGENFQNFFTYEETMDYSFFSEAQTITERLLEEIFQEIYFPTTNLNKKEALYIINNMIEYFEKELEDFWT